MGSRREEITIALGGKDEGAGTLLDRTAQKIRALKAEQRASGEKGLKKLIAGGPDSLLEFGGNLVGGAKFGLAAFAIGQAAHAIDGMADKATELKKQWKEGALDADTMVDTIAGAIPVIGEVWTAGRKVHGLLFGDVKEDWEKLNKEADEHYEKVARQTEVYNRLKEEVKGLREAEHKEIRGIVQTSADNQVEDLDQELANRKKQLQKERLDAQVLGVTAYNERIREIEAAEEEAEASHTLRVSKIRMDEFEKRATAELAHAREAAQARAEIEEEMLRQGGMGYAADLHEAERAGADKKRQMEDQANAELAAGTASVDWLTQLEKRKELVDQQTADRKTSILREQLISEHRLYSELAQKRFIAQGQNLAAELEQIRMNYADRIEAAKSEAERETLAREQAIDEAQARRAGAIAERDRVLDVRRSLDGLKLSELEEKAASNLEAKREAMKLRIHMETASEMHEFQKIIDDTKSTAAERSAAAAAIAKLKADERRKDKNIDESPIPDRRGGVEALLLGDRFLGIGVRYKAGGEPALEQLRNTSNNTQKSVVTLAEIAGYLKTVSEKLSGGVAQQGFKVKAS
jgi:hypothetical protein